MNDKPRDPREQPVIPERPAVPVPIDLYRVTPASLAYAKQEAARERAEVDAVLRDSRRANAKELLRDLVQRFGVLDVRTLLDEIESER